MSKRRSLYCGATLCPLGRGDRSHRQEHQQIGAFHGLDPSGSATVDCSDTAHVYGPRGFGKASVAYTDEGYLFEPVARHVAAKVPHVHRPEQNPCYRDPPPRVSGLSILDNLISGIANQCAFTIYDPASSIGRGARDISSLIPPSSLYCHPQYF